MIKEKKITGGLVAGVREGVFIIDLPFNQAVGEFLRGLPFWAALKWTVYPLQSPKSCVEQDRVAFQKARDKGLTEFERYLLKEKIRFIEGRVNHPETNGKIKFFDVFESKLKFFPSVEESME